MMIFYINIDENDNQSMKSKSVTRKFMKNQMMNEIFIDNKRNKINL